MLLLGAAAVTVFLIACYHDIRHRSIPNMLPVAVTVLAVMKWLIIGQLAAALWALAAAAAVLVVTALLFSQGWIGGGDVKLGSAAVFLLGAPATPRFLLLMALIGGVIAVVILLRLGLVQARLQPADAGDAAMATPTIPYGVAIAAAAIVMMAAESPWSWPA
ncbi:MAG: A24 family peptidase [Stellaceae bacterium]